MDPLGPRDTAILARQIANAVAPRVQRAVTARMDALREENERLASELGFVQPLLEQGHGKTILQLKEAYALIALLIERAGGSVVTDKVALGRHYMSDDEIVMEEDEGSDKVTFTTKPAESVRV